MNISKRRIFAMAQALINKVFHHGSEAPQKADYLRGIDPYQAILDEGQEIYAPSRVELWNADDFLKAEDPYLTSGEGGFGGLQSYNPSQELRYVGSGLVERNQQGGQPKL